MSINIGNYFVETDDYLATQTQNNPNMAAYAFCIAHNRPGNFYLAYKFNLNDRPRHEVSYT